jgi:Fic family protein
MSWEAIAQFVINHRFHGSPGEPGFVRAGAGGLGWDVNGAVFARGRDEARPSRCIIHRRQTMHYTPPYTLTDGMLTAAVTIGEKAKRIEQVRAFEARPQLRRNNRIRSIHSSLAIEANSLTVDEVRDVIDGRVVLGPAREIQEVKNAWAAYEQLGRFDPCSLDELKRLHGIMTHLTVQESGMFRTHDEGVFSGDRCIFMAPPPQFVPEHMASLFDWMRQAKGSVHPLILSSVFHYEFVFIHPFEDGNGRMARLWQTALLAEWNPVFQYLPLESRIHEFQDAYYTAIAACNQAGNSDAFIVFMMDAIDRTLDWALRQTAGQDAVLSRQVQELLGAMETGIPYTGAQLMEKLGLKSRVSFRKTHLLPAIEQGLVRMLHPDKPSSRNQAYIKT